MKILKGILRGILRWGVRIFALALVVGIVWVIIYGYKTKPGWVGVSDKKFWDYLDLLIVPAALAIGVAWLNWAQRKREREAEDAQQKHELDVENQRAQDEALQAYLYQMSQLLVDKERPLRRARPGDDLSVVARARTLTVLLRLGANRKRSVVQFLYESGLINRGNSIVVLGGIPLTRDPYKGRLIQGPFPQGKGPNITTAMSGANLRDAHLNSVNLRRADLRHTDLKRAQLHHADLSHADLRGADLRGANLSYANLTGADLSEAHLGEANLVGAYLYEAKLNYIEWYGTNLRSAELTDAEMFWANLRNADLRSARMPNGEFYKEEHPKDEKRLRKIFRAFVIDCSAAPLIRYSKHPD